MAKNLPKIVCARRNKGWAFMGKMTLEEYKRDEVNLQEELKREGVERFKQKYAEYLY